MSDLASLPLCRSLSTHPVVRARRRRHASATDATHSSATTAMPMLNSFT